MPYFPPETGGGSAGTFVSSETPSGPVDGSNTVFVLSNTPISGSTKLFLNGVRQKETLDFNISGVTITFVSAPYSGDIVLCDYNYL